AATAVRSHAVTNGRATAPIEIQSDSESSSSGLVAEAAAPTSTPVAKTSEATKSVDNESAEPFDLSRLLTGVRFYVEIRQGIEDRSEGIAEEMTRLGASISDRVNLSVTHILYRAGRKKTHDFAVKHGIPMVSVSWPLACIKAKRQVSHEPFLLPAGAWSADDNSAGGTSSPLLNQLRKQRRRFMQPGLDPEKELKSSADRLRRKRMKTAVVDSLKIACQKSAEEYANFNDNYYLSVKLRVPTTPPSMKELQERLDQQRRDGIRFNGSLSDSSSVGSDVEDGDENRDVVGRDDKKSVDEDSKKPAVILAPETPAQENEANIVVETTPVPQLSLEPEPAPVPALEHAPEPAAEPAPPPQPAAVPLRPRPGKRRLYNAETDDFCASFSDSLSSSQASSVELRNLDDATPSGVARRRTSSRRQSLSLKASSNTTAMTPVNSRSRRSRSSQSPNDSARVVSCVSSAEQRRYNRQKRSLMMLQNEKSVANLATSEATTSKAPSQVPPPRRPFDGIELPSPTATIGNDSSPINLTHKTGAQDKRPKYRRLYTAEDDELSEPTDSPATADQVACYRAFPKPVLRLLAQKSNNQAAKLCMAPSPSQVVANLPGRGGSGTNVKRTGSTGAVKKVSNISHNHRFRFGPTKPNCLVARQLPAVMTSDFGELQTGLAAILKTNGRFETPPAQQQKPPPSTGSLSQEAASSSQLSTASSIRKSILQSASTSKDSQQRQSRRITFAANVDVASIESIANRSSAPLKSSSSVIPVSAVDTPTTPTSTTPQASSATPQASSAQTSTPVMSLSTTSKVSEQLVARNSSPRVALWDIRCQSNLDKETRSLLSKAQTAASANPVTLLDIAEESSGAKLTPQAATDASASAACSQASTASDTSGMGILDACNKTNVTSKDKTNKKNSTGSSSQISQASQACSSTSTNSVPSRRSLDDFQLPLLSVSGLSSEQRRTVQRALGRMPETYSLVTSETLSSNTAVLVTCNPPKRTLAVLSALAYSVPIVSIDWIIDSLAKRSWLPMNSYSVAQQASSLASRVAHDCSSSLTATEEKKRSKLFAKLAEMYIAPSLTGLDRAQLLKLIRAAGGRTVDSYRSAPICIGCCRSNAMSHSSGSSLYSNPPPPGVSPAEYQQRWTSAAAVPPPPVPPPGYAHLVPGGHHLHPLRPPVPPTSSASAVGASSAELEASRRWVSDLNEEVQRLTAELATAQTANASLKERLKDEQQRNLEKTLQLQEQNESEAKCEQLQASLTETQTALDEIKAKLAKCRCQANLSSQTNHDSNPSADEGLSAMLEIKDSIIEKQQAFVKELERRMSEADKQNRQQVAAIEAELATATAELNQKAEQLESQSADDSAAKLAKLSSELENLKQSNSDLAARVDSGEVKIRDLNSLLAYRQQLVDSAKSETAEALRRLAEAKADSEAKAARADAAAAELDTMKGRLLQLEENREKLVDRLSQQLKDLRTDNEAKRSELFALRAKLDKRQDSEELLRCSEKKRAALEKELAAVKTRQAERQAVQIEQQPQPDTDAPSAKRQKLADEAASSNAASASGETDDAVKSSDSDLTKETKEKTPENSASNPVTSSSQDVDS
uniref:BRCT domain-containing protein n=1 Tax=Macrostomum lignano TaxID=282301 RepID=A0A1I8I8M2_9PLAT